MTQFINSFYALEDIKKRTAKFFEKTTAQEDNERAAQKEKEEMYSQLADSFIFKYFYMNKRSLIKQHIKEVKEEQQA